MNQMVPVIAFRRIKLADSAVLPYIAPEDFIIRGIIVPGQSGTYPCDVDLYKGGSDPKSPEGETLLQTVNSDYCYDFIPLEIPLETDDLLKVHLDHKGAANANGSKMAILSDKAIDLRRWLEDWGTNRFTWTGDQPEIEDDETYGKVGNFEDISIDAYVNIEHSHFILDTVVKQNLYWTLDTLVLFPVLRWRCDQDSSDCYELQLGTYKRDLGGAVYGYSGGLRIVRKVTGESDAIVYDAAPGPGSSAWLNPDPQWTTPSPLTIYHADNRIILSCGDFGSCDLLDTSEYAIASGDYFCVPEPPSGGGFKFAKIEIW